MADQQWKVTIGGHRLGGIAIGRPLLASQVGATVRNASYTPTVTESASYIITTVKAGQTG